MSLVLGVDGGNSKAIALVARRDGSIIGAARRSGSADIYAGETTALDLLRDVVDDAVADAGVTRSEIGSAAFSLAGADWPEDIDLLRSSLGRLRFMSPPIVVNDAIGALAGAVPGGPAVVVSIGTGAATGARGEDGSTWHSSFWQVTQGGAELARLAIGAMARAGLGIEPAPVLQEALLAAIGAASVDEALHRSTRRERDSPETMAAVVRALFAAADAGDPVAEGIVAQHGTGIGEIAAAAARRVGNDRVPYALAFCGGVTRTGVTRLIAAAADAIVAAGQTPRLTPARWQPAVGALLLGLGAVEVRPMPAVAARLDATVPSAEFFDAGA